MHMIDWGKYWVCNPVFIDRIFNIEDLNFTEKHNCKTGIVSPYPKKAIWKCWEFEIKSPTWLEIRGSMHNYWNGTNENDFPQSAVSDTIYEFCSFLKVDSNDLSTCNLEFSVTVCPEVDASEIISNVICYKNRPPVCPYVNNHKMFFIEFKTGQYYFKIYDKGKQCISSWNRPCGNRLRVEVKAIRSRYLQKAGIMTMHDLLDENKVQKLGYMLLDAFQHVVFDDPGICPANLSEWDRKVYEPLRNPREWTDVKKNKTSTHRSREKRFREIVQDHGKYRHSENISRLISEKWQELISS